MGLREEEKGAGKIALKRELGLFSAVSIILAVMIGKGTRRSGEFMLFEPRLGFRG